jgi:tRNA threonylcarbamoyladenosine biosynthesis protein TsaB
LIILTIRSDKPEAEVGLFKDDKQLVYEKWQAHRELSVTLPGKIEDILNKSSITYDQLDGVVVYKGPGSFTGLRIGISAANALAYSKNLPIVAANSDCWVQVGMKMLKKGQNDKIALPEYGAPPFVTQPKK